jgi:hypothetical protein
MRSTLRVEGGAAARGRIRIAGSPRVSGTLGRRHFDVNLAKVHLADKGGRASLLPGERSLVPRLPSPAFVR